MPTAQDFRKRLPVTAVAQVDAHRVPLQSTTSPAEPLPMRADVAVDSASRSPALSPLGFDSVARSTVMPNCELADADLIHADLRNADLTAADLQRANLGRAP